MKVLLRTLALVLALTAGLLWLGLGANRGWTRTSEAVKMLDEVTGIEGIVYRDRFVPGVDFLAGALAGAVVLAGASFFFRQQQNNTTK